MATVTRGWPFCLLSLNLGRIRPLAPLSQSGRQGVTPLRSLYRKGYAFTNQKMPRNFLRLGASRLSSSSLVNVFILSWYLSAAASGDLHTHLRCQKQRRKPTCGTTLALQTVMNLAAQTEIGLSKFAVSRILKDVEAAQMKLGRWE